MVAVIAALNDLGVPCADKAPSASVFELTPAARTKVAADVTKLLAKAPEWKKTALDRVIAQLKKPYEPPNKRS